jgi:hypothetical protein
MTTINDQLANQIAHATKSIPKVYYVQPAYNTVISSPDSAFEHLQAWAFTQGLAFVVEHHDAKRVRWGCIFHKSNTRNTRKIEEADRERVGTYVRGTGCQVYFYVSFQKRQGDQWIFCHGKHLKHNHEPSPDPFALAPHRNRRPGYLQALRVTETHRGVLGFRTSSDILERIGLEIDRKEYYNLHRKEAEEKLTPQSEARMIITYLNDQGCHVFVNEQYVLDNLGNKTDRVIMSIIWFTPEQLRLNRRFVSGFLIESDATFNKESRRLLLHNLIGIDNCGKTYLAL